MLCIKKLQLSFKMKLKVPPPLGVNLVGEHGYFVLSVKVIFS